MIAIGCGNAPSAPSDARTISLADAPVDADCGDTCNPYDNVGCSPPDVCKVMHLGGGPGCPACLSAGAVPLGGACTIADGLDDCGKDGYCLDGTCRQICGGGSIACTLGYCPSFNGPTLCTLPCDPFAATTTCVAGEGCYAATVMTTPGCAPTGITAAGASCANVNDCAPGLTCLYASGRGTCVPLCNLGGEPSCAPPSTCTALGDSTIYGVCVTP